MTSSVLITGGAGFIGCRLAQRLVGAGAEVTVFDNLHPQVHATEGRPAELPDEARLFVGDVAELDAWSAVLHTVEPSVVVHLAAETGTAQSLTEAGRHGRTNVLGTTSMIEALQRWGPTVGHVVLASSRAVYGEGTWVDVDGNTYDAPPRTIESLTNGRWDPAGPSGLPGTPMPHEATKTPPRPVSVYGATKLAQEHLLAAWSFDSGAALSILRMQNVYGPGQSPHNPYAGVLAGFARQASCGDVIDVYEDGRMLRDFVFVDDVVDAFSAAVERVPTSHRLLDIGSGAPVSMLEVAELIAVLMGGPSPRISGRFRVGDIRSAHCATTPAEVELGHRAQRSLQSGLREFCNWVLSSDSRQSLVSPT